MQTTGTLITASVATLLAAVSPVIADEHHHRGGGGNGWHGGGQQWHGGAWHEHHGGDCGWSCSLGLGALAFGGVLAALLYHAPPPVYYSTAGIRSATALPSPAAGLLSPAWISTGLLLFAAVNPDPKDRKP